VSCFEDSLHIVPVRDASEILRDALHIGKDDRQSPKALFNLSWYAIVGTVSNRNIFIWQVPEVKWWYLKVLRFVKTQII
jgi:hypothetical protein